MIQLQAGNDIQIGGRITNRDTARPFDMTVIAGRDLFIGGVNHAAEINSNNGDITVIAGRNIDLISGAAGASATVFIGGAAGGTTDAFGTISVMAGGDINLAAGATGSSLAYISKTINTFNAFYSDPVIVTAGGDVTLTPNIGGDAFIGLAPTGTFVDAASDILVTVGGDLNLTNTAGAVSDAYIGLGFKFGTAGIVQGSTTVNVAGATNLTSVAGAGASGLAYIGADNIDGGEISNHTITLNTGSLNITSNSTTNTVSTYIGFDDITAIGSKSNNVINVNVTGNATLTNNSTAGGLGAPIYIGMANLSTTLPVELTTNVTVGGTLSMITTSQATSPTYIGSETIASTGGVQNTTNVVAGTLNLQANSTNAAGSVFIGMDVATGTSISNSSTNVDVLNTATLTSTGAAPTYIGSGVVITSSVASDVSLSTGQDLNLFPSPASTAKVYVGFDTINLSTVSGNIDVDVGANINLTGINAPTYIGLDTPLNGSTIESNLDVLARGNINMIADTASGNTFIGTNSLVDIAGIQQTVSVFAQDSIFMDGTNGPVFITGINDGSNAAFPPIVTVEAGVDIYMVQSSMNSSFTLYAVVDQLFGTRPLIGPGLFSIDATSSLNSFTSAPIGIYTALQSLNSFDPNAIIGGMTFADWLAALGLSYPGPLYENSLIEIWCTYFNEMITFPNSPFTIFYKDCLEQAAYQASIIVDQFLVDLHPFNEFPGWAQRFSVRYSPSLELIFTDEPYLLRRRHLKQLNHPKTWTVLQDI